jgi:dihydroflavonol-4-reductase
MSFRRALVTGGAGFAGTHLVRSFVRNGVPVTVLTRDAGRARGRLPEGVRLVEGRIEDESSVRDAVAGCDLVVHMATSFRTSKITDAEHRAIHVDGTRLLLDACRDAGVARIVHVSTVGVTSHVEDPPGDETLPYGPDDVYQSTKAEAEQLALEMHRERGDPVVVIRPTPIYGPGDLRLLKLFRMVARGRFVMFGSGEVCFHMVHVDDLVRGIRLAAEAPDRDVLGEVFIVGGEEYCTINELVARIARETGGSEPRLRLPVAPVLALGSVVEALLKPLRIEPPLFRRRVNWFIKNRAFSIEKARRVLGYQPRVGLDAGLRQTVAWYRAEGLLPGTAVPAHVGR